MKMNAITKKILILIVMAIYTTVLSGCTERVTDFGFDGQLSGMILDQNGNPVPGDISNASLTVFVLGAEDRVPLELRVKADGSYANLHLFPQSYTVWIEGPVDSPGGQEVDLTGDPVEHNITVAPYMAISPPENVSISGDELSVSYNITPGQGHAAEERVLIVSTVSDPGMNTGNGPRWQTRLQTLESNSGTATITLDPELLESAENRSGSLFIRVAARSDLTNEFNLSLQHAIETP